MTAAAPDSCVEETRRPQREWSSSAESFRPSASSSAASTARMPLTKRCCRYGGKEKDRSENVINRMFKQTTLGKGVRMILLSCWIVVKRPVYTWSHIACILSNLLGLLFVADVNTHFEVESWLALWVAVLLHSLCPLASVCVCVFRMHSACWRTRTPGTAPWASSWTPCKERRSAPLSTARFWVRLLGL